MSGIALNNTILFNMVPEFGTAVYRSADYSNANLNSDLEGQQTRQMANLLPANVGEPKFGLGFRVRVRN